MVEEQHQFFNLVHVVLERTSDNYAKVLDLDPSRILDSCNNVIELLCTNWRKSRRKGFQVHYINEFVDSLVNCSLHVKCF